MEWVLLSSARNEAFDAEVYAYAAAVRAGLQRMNWDALEDAVAAKSQSANPAPERAASRESQPQVLRSRWMSSVPTRSW